MSKVRIYFLQIIGDGPIKIGVTGGPLRQRIAGLQTSCPWPIHVLGEIFGEPRIEGVLHAYLGRHRMAGEWFAPERLVIETVQSVLEGRFEWPTKVEADPRPAEAQSTAPVHLTLPRDLSLSVRCAAVQAGMTSAELVIDILRDAIVPAGGPEHRLPVELCAQAVRAAWA